MFVFFFFFQAEDGIRDKLVTGVQTCALPICYLWGTGAGLGLAALAHLVPPLRRGSDRLAAVLNSVPSIALGPIFLVLLSRESTPAAVSSIHVFFIVFVSMGSGLQRATVAHRDLFAVLGAARLKRFWRLELPAALPALVSGLR